MEWEPTRAGDAGSSFEDVGLGCVAAGHASRGVPHALWIRLGSVGFGERFVLEPPTRVPGKPETSESHGAAGRMPVRAVRIRTLRTWFSCSWAARYMDSRKERAAFLGKQ